MVATSLSWLVDVVNRLLRWLNPLALTMHHAPCANDGNGQRRTTREQNIVASWSWSAIFSGMPSCVRRRRRIASSRDKATEATSVRERSTNSRASPTARNENRGGSLSMSTLTTACAGNLPQLCSEPSTKREVPVRSQQGNRPPRYHPHRHMHHHLPSRATLPRRTKGTTHHEPGSGCSPRVSGEKNTTIDAGDLGRSLLDPVLEGWRAVGKISHELYGLLDSVS